MIEKMNKYSFLIYYKDYDAFLEKLRSVGVVHIIEKEKGTFGNDTVIQQKMQEAQKLKATIADLEKRKPAKATEVKQSEDTAEELLIAIEKVKDWREKADTALELSKKESTQMVVWGDFDMTMPQKLIQAGYIMEFYFCPTSRFQEEWKDKYNAFVSSQSGGHIYFVTITKKSVELEIEADKVKLADYSYSDMLKEQEELRNQIALFDTALENYAESGLETLKQAQLDFQDVISLDTVKLNTYSEVENKVMLLEGWSPVSKEEDLIQMLHEEGTFYQTDEPEKTENVPILLKNNKFAQLFEPIGEMYSLPNYHGIDMTVFWAPFYTIFFGICMGDAGYGLLLVAISSFLLLKGKESIKSMARLILALGISTIIFGTICGSFFGIELTNVQASWMTGLKAIMIDSNQLFSLSLILGVIQLSFAMIIKGVKEILLKGFRYSLDTWGWFLCLWGNGITYLLSTNGTIAPEIAKYLYIGINTVALSCMLFFNNPEGSLLSNIGGGLWGLYNKATGILGDLLSYIRLFALGISGAILGLVFNQLAVNISNDVSIAVVSQLIMVLILLIGHAMNIFISGLSAFVHPMRLTFIEFYNNAGFESGGRKYNPFKKQTNQL